jgi:hypothetical protein
MLIPNSDRNLLRVLISSPCKALEIIKKSRPEYNIEEWSVRSLSAQEATLLASCDPSTLLA